MMSSCLLHRLFENHSNDHKFASLAIVNIDASRERHHIDSGDILVAPYSLLGEISSDP